MRLRVVTAKLRQQEVKSGLKAGAERVGRTARPYVVREIDNLMRSCAKDFDSQFDSHGLGQGRMKGTRAETRTRDLARFGRGRTPFPLLSRR